MNFPHFDRSGFQGGLGLVQLPDRRIPGHDELRGTTRAVLRVAPLSVSNLLRGRLFDTSTVILTSATLTVGGTPFIRRVYIEKVREVSGTFESVPFDYPDTAAQMSWLTRGSAFNLFTTT